MNFYNSLNCKGQDSANECFPSWTPMDRAKWTLVSHSKSTAILQSRSNCITLYTDTPSVYVPFICYGSTAEFLLAVWNYCTFNKYSLIRFAFELYDEDQSGSIDVEEMTLMLKDVYGKKALTNNRNAAFVLDKIKVLGGGLTNATTIEVSYPIFLDFCNKHPALLFPAFHLQLTLQTKIIGRRFWEGLEKKRDRIQKKAAKNGMGGGENSDDMNFRDVMKFLTELNDDDREAALNQAMESAVDAIEETFQEDAKAQARREIGRLKTMAQTESSRGTRHGGPRSSRNSKLRRSSTTGSAHSRRSGGGGGGGSGGGNRGSGGSQYSVESSSDSSSRTGLGGSLMKGGKSWKCGTFVVDVFCLFCILLFDCILFPFFAMKFLIVHVCTFMYSDVII